MTSRPGYLAPFVLAAVLFCFSLPFVTVSCRSRTVDRTGLELVAREKPVIRAEPEGSSIAEAIDRLSVPARAAFGAACLSLVLSIVAFRQARGYRRYLLAAALVALPALGTLYLLAFFGLAGGDPMEDETQVHHRLGYWLAMGLLFVASILHVPTLAAARSVVPHALAAALLSVILAMFALGIGLWGLLVAPIGFIVALVAMRSPRRTPGRVLAWIGLIVSICAVPFAIAAVG